MLRVPWRGAQFYVVLVVVFLLFGPVCFAMDFLGVCSRCGVHVGAVVGVGWGVVWGLLGVGMGCRGLPC